MARSFVRASSNRITLAPFSNTPRAFVLEQSAMSLAGWFRTSNAGTDRMVVYSETAQLAGRDLFVAVNDTVAGRIRVFRRSSSATANLTHDGGYNDGEWHFFTFVSRAMDDHELFIDGVSVATSSTDITGTLTPQTRGIGFRSSYNADHFDGEIADMAAFKVALTLEEHLLLHAKDKTPVSIRSDYRNAVAGYYPLAGSVIADEASSVRSQRFPGETAPALSGTTQADGPDGGFPTGIGADTDLSRVEIFYNPTAMRVPAGGSGTTDRLIREIGNVVHDPDDALRPYKFYYSGVPSLTYSYSNVTIHCASSVDQVTWTKEGEVISAPTEDPYVVLHDGTYHLWCEDKEGATSSSNKGVINHYTSPDGLAWTLENENALASSEAWEAFDVASPVVWLEGDVWYMVYEGRSTSSNGSIGIATADSPNGPWTKYAGNPVMAPTTAQKAQIGHDITKIGGVYYMLLSMHETPFACYIAHSADLVNWTVGRPGLFPPGSGPMLLRGDLFDRALISVDFGDVYEVTALGGPVVQESEWPGQSPPAAGDVLPEPHEIALVVSSLTHASTAAIEAVLQSLGYVVTVITDDLIGSTDFSGFDAVVALRNTNTTTVGDGLRALVDGGLPMVLAMISAGVSIGSTGTFTLNDVLATNMGFCGQVRTVGTGNTTQLTRNVDILAQENLVGSGLNTGETAIYTENNARAAVDDNGTIVGEVLLSMLGELAGKASTFAVERGSVVDGGATGARVLVSEAVFNYAGAYTGDGLALIDQMVQWVMRLPPGTPAITADPDENEVTLSGSAYVHERGTPHVASRWQVDLEGGDFSDPFYDATSPFSLESRVVSGLDLLTAYVARVRYQDGNGEWSEWSDGVDFETSPSAPPLFEACDEPSGGTAFAQCPTVGATPFEACS